MAFKVGDRVWSVSDHRRHGVVVGARQNHEGVPRIKVRFRLDRHSAWGYMGDEHDEWYDAHYWIGVEEMTALTLMGDDDGR